MIRQDSSRWNRYGVILGLTILAWFRKLVAGKFDGSASTDEHVLVRVHPSGRKQCAPISATWSRERRW
jgi:hypothetical protein